jgi:hypothetical protein
LPCFTHYQEEEHLYLLCQSRNKHFAYTVSFIPGISLERDRFSFRGVLVCQEHVLLVGGLEVPHIMLSPNIESSMEMFFTFFVLAGRKLSARVKVQSNQLFNPNL